MKEEENEILAFPENYLKSSVHLKKAYVGIICVDKADR